MKYFIFLKSGEYLDIDADEAMKKYPDYWEYDGDWWHWVNEDPVYIPFGEENELVPPAVLMAYLLLK